jgi:hypothetical protein
VVAELIRLEAQAGTRIYAAISDKPPLTRLLVRGQVTEPADVMAPGGVAATGQSRAWFGLTAFAPEPERRRRLAEWVVHRDNPLFARVMVNRLWHHHFGTGIVETPSDFGFNGARPSHPELLDWLAAGFAEGGYSLKQLHRLIVTSATYRQSSRPDPAALAVDADSRLLWRKKPARLEAEALRDNMLAVAGLLDRTPGGAGFSDYREQSLNGTTYFEPIDPATLAAHRRSIYRFTPRGANPGLLDVFDCPDPASATPRRAFTTTPLQALALWNNGFSLRMAETFARRVEGEASDVDGLVRRAYQIALQRDPLPDEAGPAQRLVAEHGVKALCRALFNMNELLTVE